MTLAALERRSTPVRTPQCQLMQADAGEGTTALWIQDRNVFALLFRRILGAKVRLTRRSAAGSCIEFVSRKE